MKFPFNEMEKLERSRGFLGGWGAEIKVWYVYIKSEMSIRYPRGFVE